MYITLAPLEDHDNGNTNTFTIELDYLDQDDYQKEVNQGLWYNSNGGPVLSTRCGSCDHVEIGRQLNECPECGNEEEATDEEGNPNPAGLEHKDTNTACTVISSEDIPSTYIDGDELEAEFWEYKDLLSSSYLSAEAIDAGLECGISLNNIEEAYQGEYRCNTDFAEQMAEDLGLTSEKQEWPFNHIDWEAAAKDLMMDYSEHNGYYFRDLQNLIERLTNRT